MEHIGQSVQVGLSTLADKVDGDESARLLLLQVPQWSKLSEI